MTDEELYRARGVIRWVLLSILVVFAAWLFLHPPPTTSGIVFMWLIVAALWTKWVLWFSPWAERHAANLSEGEGGDE